MDERSPLRLSEGLVVAAVPAYGYLLAYLYQRGFATELQIPYEFIDVGLRDVLLVAAAALFILVVFVRSIADLVLSFVTTLPEDRRWRATTQLLLVWFGVNTAAVLIYQHRLDRVWPVVTYSTVLVAMAIWFTFRSHLPKSSLHHMEDRLGRSAVLGLLAVLSVAAGANALGSARALDQRYFLVLPATNEAVLAIYGDTAVLAPHADGRLQDRFRVVDVTGLDLERRRIGPLRPSEGELMHAATPAIVRRSV